MNYRYTEKEGWINLINSDGTWTTFNKKHKKLWSDYEVWINKNNTTLPAHSDDDDYTNKQIEMNNNARKFLNDNDWKIKRHSDQKIMIEKGIGDITETSMTEQEFEDLLLECQKQRELVTGV